MEERGRRADETFLQAITSGAVVRPLQRQVTGKTPRRCAQMRVHVKLHIERLRSERLFLAAPARRIVTPERYVSTVTTSSRAARPASSRAARGSSAVAIT